MYSRANSKRIESTNFSFEYHKNQVFQKMPLLKVSQNYV